MQNEGGLCQVLSPNAASALPDSCLLDVLFKRPVRAVSMPPCSQRNKRWLVGLMKHPGCWMRLQWWLEKIISPKQCAECEQTCAVFLRPCQRLADAGVSSVEKYRASSVPLWKHSLCIQWNHSLPTCLQESVEISPSAGDDGDFCMFPSSYLLLLSVSSLFGAHPFCRNPASKISQIIKRFSFLHICIPECNRFAFTLVLIWACISHPSSVKISSCSL